MRLRDTSLRDSRLREACRIAFSFFALSLGAAMLVGCCENAHAAEPSREQFSVLVIAPELPHVVDVSATAEQLADSGGKPEKLSREIPQSANTSPAAVAAAAGDAPATAEQVDALGEKVRRVLDRYYARKQNVDRRTPWEVMHWAVAFGTDTYLNRGAAGEDVTAIGWLGWNGRCKGQSLLYVDAKGRLGVQKGPGVQGHDGQLLAIYAQSRIRSDYPLRASGKMFTVADLIDFEQRTCEPGSELTFKLIALSHYLPLDATWPDDQNRTWSVERLIREELAQKVIGAACGGTHRLTGLSYAVHKAQATGEPLAGEFARAEKFIREYHRYTWTLQNADGSFSTDYFRNRAASSDVARRLETTGHTLEWLAYSLPADELKQNRCVRAVDYLADILLAEPDRDWHMGGLGHGLHALAIYEQRTAAQWKPQRPTQEVAGTDTKHDDVNGK
ncbi:MAG: hypothetical protein WD875_10210 [Pirellulales bacterium]